MYFKINVLKKFFQKCHQDVLIRLYDSSTFSFPQIQMIVTTTPVTVTQQDVKITKAVTSVLYNMFSSPEPKAQR